MADSTTINNETSANANDEIRALKDVVNQMREGMTAFSGAVIQALTGQSQTVATPAKRRGRPPKAETLARAATPDGDRDC